MAESKKKGLGLPQTRGSFQVRGKVTGTDRDSFYTEKLTKSDKPWRSVNFGIQFTEDSTIFVGLNGMEKDSVYFSKRVDGKTEIKEVPWKDRLTFVEKDFSLIGVNLGVSKIKDAKGNEVNDKKRRVEYDACKEISDNLVDGQTVFVRGNIEYGSYQERHTTKFVPSQISLAKDIDFKSEDFNPLADFTQVIVFMGITPNEDKTRATVSAKIVNYDSIEDAEFIITDMNLAKIFNKNLKPYMSIKVWGNINVEKSIEEIESTDCWGVENNMDKVKAPTIRELVITGADPSTIDKTTYTEEELDKAIEASKTAKAAEKDFGGSTDGWGSVGSSLDDEDESGW